jgi:hypothetical protein
MLDHANWLKGQTAAGASASSASDVNESEVSAAEYREYRSIRKNAHTVSPTRLQKSRMMKGGGGVPRGTGAGGVGGQWDDEEGEDWGVSHTHSHNKSQGIAGTGGTGGTGIPLASTHMGSVGSVGGSSSSAQNPYRQKNLRICNVRKMPKHSNGLDPLVYKDETSIRTVGGTYNACIKPSLNPRLKPSLSEVTDTMATLSKKALLSYTTRVVEVGAALKALKDPCHPAPGLHAILSLHRYV